MKELDILLVMIDLEYLSKDEPNGQLLDIGICYGTSPENLRRISYKPLWQEDGVVQPSTLKFWAEHNPKQLAKYLTNTQPVQWVARDLVSEIHALTGRARQLKVKQVVLMSKGITHDLPKLEYLLENNCDFELIGASNGGLGFFESLFGYNCRRDFRSFKMSRPKELLDAAREYAEEAASRLKPEGALHDAEYDALVQWHEFYWIATN